jgi:putative toxin-antitoxin system antitoxin component (TIGR02293 family)
MKPSSERSTAKPKKGTSQTAGAEVRAEDSRITAYGNVQASGKEALKVKMLTARKRGRHVHVLDKISVALEGSRVMAHDVVMKGVSGRALTRIWETTRGSLPPDAILKAIGVSERTAHRIKADPDKPLDARTTDGIYRLESVRAMAEEVLGSTEAANEWLSNEAMGLEFRKPIDLLSTSPGAEAVKTLLQRMKYGVYA